MTIFSRIDAWLGKTLFHPPIILACQLTRQTQYAMHRALWFFAACHATVYLEHDDWLWVVFMWFFVAITLLSATVYADWPAVSIRAFRLFWFFLLIGQVSVTLLGGELLASSIRSVIILFAEYAATIKTIPPRRKREKRASAKEVRT
ncbi:hypothetical protein [Sphingobium yanoikuyae]|uniref:Uncharacterized protein n=1 Tax=Sphingobium yanoikuyae TaxID=13690 RepID=A0A9X7U8K4_SPHYA|nr:hypothetical protein [Sphingobium yanoikuyae]QNG44669.1 hypothetical protein H3V42_22885 [Sphingobium yanoikuyae]